MLRNSLLLTTAFVVVGTLSFLVAQSTAIAGPMNVGVVRDRNSEFLHAYTGGHGWCGKRSFSVSAYSVALTSDSIIGGWQYVAVPVTGSGKSVNRIYVREGYDHEYPSADRFSVGIYSNAPSGFPGKLIAGGKASASPSCGIVAVSVPSTKLAHKTVYWVEETAPISNHYSSLNYAYWKAASHSRRKAYVRTKRWHWSQGSSSSQTSPWKELSAAPFFRLGYSGSK